MTRFILYPFLFASYWVLSFIANNIDRVSVSDAARIYIILLGVIGIYFIILKFLIRSWHRAGLVTGLTLFLSASFIPVYNALHQGQASVLLILGQANVLAAVWASVFVLLGWRFIRKLKNPRPLSETLNVMALVLLVFPIVQIGAFWANPGPNISHSVN